MRSYAAERDDIFRRVRIPDSLPFVFSALKVASVLAMIGAVVGEYFGGSPEALGQSSINGGAVRLATTRRVGRHSWLRASSGIAFYATIAGIERYGVALAPVRAADGIVGGYDWLRDVPRPRNGGHVKSNASGVWWGWWGRGVAWPAVDGGGSGGGGLVGGPKLTKVTLQLKWVTQSQFAGYYAAKAKGYYQTAGLDVTISRPAARRS